MWRHLRSWLYILHLVSMYQASQYPVNVQASWFVPYGKARCVIALQLPNCWTRIYMYNICSPPTNSSTCFTRQRHWHTMLQGHTTVACLCPSFRRRRRICLRPNYVGGWPRRQGWRTAGTAPICWQHPSMTPGQYIFYQQHRIVLSGM